MKRISILFIFALVCATFCFAQPRAVGGRIGYGIDASYQHSIGKSNMVSLDAGVAPSYLSLAITHGPQVVATYDWINPFNTQIPWKQKGEWNWYMGVGAAAYVGFRQNSPEDAGSGSGSGDWFNDIINDIIPDIIFGYSGPYDLCTVTSFGAVGRVGVEYNFWFPLQLAVEWRPILGPQFESYWLNGKKQHSITDLYRDGLVGIALAVRYKF